MKTVYRLLCTVLVLSLLLFLPALAAGEPELLACPNADAAREAEYAAYWEAHPTMTAQQAVTFVNSGLNRPFYTGVSSVPDPNDILVLVNKYHALSSSYVPSDLTGLRYGSAGVTLRSEAAQAFDRMAAAARAAGVTILGVSGYRSYSLQSSLYSRYSAKDGQAAADRYSARPGYSEHQTGLAIDVSNGGVYTQFGGTAAHAWAVDHLHEYGFIIRYTKANEWITGYKDEAWHFRYVGVQAATEIYHLGITLEEYLDRYVYPTGISTAPAESLSAAAVVLSRTEGPRPRENQTVSAALSNLLIPLSARICWAVDGVPVKEEDTVLQNGAVLSLPLGISEGTHTLSLTLSLPGGEARTWNAVLPGASCRALWAGCPAALFLPESRPAALWKQPNFPAFI